MKAVVALALTGFAFTNPLCGQSIANLAEGTPFDKGTLLTLAILEPPGAEPAKKKVYDESADARAQIAAALASAKRENRRVLIQWGGNWCPWCLRMDDLFHSDKAVAKTLQYEYDLVHADCGRPNCKNCDLAIGYGAGIKEEGFPYFTILDAEGKPLANKGTREFEMNAAAGQEESLKAGHDPKIVLKFLQDYKAAPADAKAVLDKAQAGAKSAGKTVFLHFGAPWCVWCHRMENWMARPDVAAILAKDFIDVKIDNDRMTGGQAMCDTFAGPKSGIPFFAFVGPDGKPIADGKGPKGNIGFPSEPYEIVHFESMLRKAKKNMTDADIAALLHSLKENKPAEPAGH